MKKLLLFISILMLYVMTSSGKVWIVTNQGVTFTPATTTITHGDSVKFNINMMHDVVEVSLATWNANDSTPLSGGFSLQDGGGLLTPTTGLTVGTHYYVCHHHVGQYHMKGTIIVNPSAGIKTISNANPFNLQVYPVPAKGSFNASYLLKEKADVEISIIDASGKTVNTLNLPEQLPGNHKIDIGINNLSGIYYIMFTDKKNTYVKKILLL